MTIILKQVSNHTIHPLCVAPLVLPFCINTLAVWFNGCILRLSSDLRLDLKNLRLYKIIGLEYVRKISDVGYRIENYNDEAEYKAKDRSCKKIRKYLIISLKKYNIQ